MYKSHGEYKGHIFKIMSTKICKAEDCEYGVVVEVDGRKRHTRLGTRKDLFDSVDAGTSAAKRYIDRITRSLTN